jgi:hypothetical protein
MKRVRIRSEKVRRHVKEGRKYCWMELWDNGINDSKKVLRMFTELMLIYWDPVSASSTWHQRTQALNL